MVSTNDSQPSSTLVDPASSPRISFSADFLDDTEFISISPGNNNSSTSLPGKGGDKDRVFMKNADFEFLSSKSLSCTNTMLSADELIFEGKLLPYTQQNHPASEKLAKISVKSSDDDDDNSNSNGDQQVKAPTKMMMSNKMEEPRIWFIDDDPSPRPPKCTVLWKELLRLKKNRPSTASSLSPSSSSSSSSSSSLGDHAEAIDEGKKSGQGLSTKEKHMRRIKKGLERTRSSSSIRIRPMVNVPICSTQGKTSSLPPLFPHRKSRVPER